MNKHKLLIVDDDENTRHALKTLYARRGWDVTLAATVAEGISSLDELPLCLILDLNLPDGGGEMVLREVRRRLLRTMVAVCSASADARQLAVVQGLNPELMLSKPIDLAPLDRLCFAAMAG